jgi:glucose-6-phosphate isomerase/transaldolase/glucose-6-phosphate isomerase
MNIDYGSLAAAYSHATERLEQMRFADALWRRSLDIWAGDESVSRTIANRLGWLRAVDFIEPERPRLEACAHSVRRDGFTDVVLLGMGGSSLAPEVLRQVLGTAPDFPRFRVLDSVDPDAVRDALQNAGTSLFVLASKSGSTIEPNAMAAEAQRRLVSEGHQEWGSRFIAITDEGTAAHRRAVQERFREVFINPSDIGGRYSALSYFGMVPAALMGIDLEQVLTQAREMERICREPSVATNPGMALGAFMAAGVRSGRDKLTLLLPERLQSFGLWVEQLVAESTGKSGTGVVPIAGEPADAPYGDDRIVVCIETPDARPDAEALGRAASSNTPSAPIRRPGGEALGAEFLRWEIATAAAGALLEINPFDEPNVQQAKDATRVLLDTYAREQRLPVAEPLASIDGLRFSMTEAALQRVEGGDVLSMLRVVEPGDYVGILAYLPPGDRELESALVELRRSVMAATGCATMFGYGPRYLHSTGQLHKGGANNGVFLILTADAATDLPVPGHPFTFGVLEQAQAIGDFQSLGRLSRRALHVHMPDRSPDRLRALADALARGRTESTASASGVGGTVNL